MILRSLILQDYGLYSGETKFDLVPRKKSGSPTPIILIGGRNGTGKTSFLEAVRLTLYGKRALGTRVGQSEYEAYLRSRISRYSGAARAAVALEFDYAEEGEVHRYLVRREWGAREQAVAESLTIEKDGIPLTSVPKEEWNHFVQELVPPGLSQLFFFDGEKIQEIADGDDSDGQLADAVRGLLGIELVNRLRSDLALYLSRHTSGGESIISSRLETLARDVTSLSRKLDELTDETAELASRRESFARVAEHAKRRFVAEGGDAALGRARIEADIEENRRSLGAAEGDLRDLASGLMPLAFAPKLTASFARSLNAAAAHKGERDAIEAVRTQMMAWGGTTARWTNEHWADIDRFATSRSPEKWETFPDIPDTTMAAEVLERLEQHVRPRLGKLTVELERLVERRDQLARSLGRADSASSGAMIEELQEAERNLGAADNALAAKQEALRLVKSELALLEKEHQRLLEQQVSEQASGRQNDLAARTAKVLLEYEYRLLDLKLDQLRSEFVRCFSHLARKSGLVADVAIDPSTFAVTMKADDGTSISRQNFSAGEKQIYATAMLWALARTSGRQLPMIIDTPLARLDTEHRANLVERYFSAASHQVILLSTDTEIDEALKARLAPWISHSYHLEYDAESRRTRVAHGYFEEAEGGVRHALQQA